MNVRELREELARVKEECLIALSGGADPKRIAAVLRNAERAEARLEEAGNERAA
jgi:hypothetical protein